MKFSTILLGIAALFVAINAAFFSIYGLSHLFAGSSESVIIMASSLELAKLIAASFLYNYWTVMSKVLRVYLTIGVMILIFITSIGVYGYLTSAFQSTSDQLSITDKKTELIELKKTRYTEELDSYNVEKSQLNTTINDLSKGLSNNVIQYKDKQSGEIITTTSSSTRKVLTEQLNDSKLQRDLITTKIDVLNDSITSLDLQVLDLKINNEVAGEVGTLRYLSDITGKDMSTIVNWLTLIIVFVFDPLAVTLVIAFNTALRVDSKKKVKSEIPSNVPIGNDGHNCKIEEVCEPVKESELGLTENEINDLEILMEEYEVPIPLDQNDDGLVTEEELRNHYEAGGWRNAHNGVPYYYHKWFDWNKPERWIKDPNAVKYWIQHKGGSHEQYSKLINVSNNNYPTDFTTKIY